MNVGVFKGLEGLGVVTYLRGEVWGRNVDYNQISRLYTCERPDTDSAQRLKTVATCSMSTKEPKDTSFYELQRYCRSTGRLRQKCTLHLELGFTAFRNAMWTSLLLFLKEPFAICKLVSGLRCRTRVPVRCLGDSPGSQAAALYSNMATYSCINNKLLSLEGTTKMVPANHDLHRTVEIDVHAVVRLQDRTLRAGSSRRVAASSIL
jgi:hypothetical protein